MATPGFEFDDPFDDDEDDEEEESLLLNSVRVCRICGCTDLTACLGADGLPCHWVTPTLCSACLEV